MAYVSASPPTKTMDQLATIVSVATAGQTLLRVATAPLALDRILPADGGFVYGLACGWAGVKITCAPPAILLEAMEPEYEQRSEQTWTVRQQFNLHLIHAITAGDTAVDAFKRAWDEHYAIGQALRAAVAARSIDLKGVFTVQAPVVFGTQAPPVLREHYFSALAVRILKGQP